MAAAMGRKRGWSVITCCRCLGRVWLDLGCGYTMAVLDISGQKIVVEIVQNYSNAGGSRTIVHKYKFSRLIALLSQDHS
jgi:hypothetical protein